MSTVFSPPSASSDPTARDRLRTIDTARGLASFLLAAAVSALVLLANQFIEVWGDGHLFAGWVALWVVIFAGSVLFAGTARRLAHRTMTGLDGWSRAMAEARAEVRMWELAKRDPRLRAEFMQAASGTSGQVEPASDMTRASGTGSSALQQQGSVPASTDAPAETDWRVVGCSTRFAPYI